MAESVLLVDDVRVDNSKPDGGLISVWTLNRPDKLNALNSDSHKEIKNQCVRVEADDNVRCVVIRGANPPEPKEGGKQKLQKAFFLFLKFFIRVFRKLNYFFHT